MALAIIPPRYVVVFVCAYSHASVGRTSNKHASATHLTARQGGGVAAACQLLRQCSEGKQDQSVCPPQGRQWDWSQDQSVCPLQSKAVRLVARPIGMYTAK